MRYDLIVVGAGPAGLAAALKAHEAGLEKILILERDTVPGGILNQCIHNGFGLHYFKEELTGPEYAERFAKRLAGTGIELRCDAMVVRLTPERAVHVLSVAHGYEVLEARAIVLAMGCRERTRGAIAIPGDRPSGVLTAGAAQRFINIEGQQVGHRVIILGSGDIGLIMARRMVLEGAEVVACVELMPFSSGLQRNITQCLDDYNIPLLLSHTITEIKGMPRVSSVVVSAVDPEIRVPIPGTEVEYEVDTVLLSVGLIPENELTRQLGVALDRRTSGPPVFENMETEMPGVFACGNVVHVHDLVDFVSAEGERAGLAAANYVLEGCSDDPERAATATVCRTLLLDEQVVQLNPGEDFGYTVPQHVRFDRLGDKLEIFTRVRRQIKSPCKIHVELNGREVAAFRKLQLAPGEMEQLTVLKKQLEKVLAELEAEGALPGPEGAVPTADASVSTAEGAPKALELKLRLEVLA